MKAFGVLVALLAGCTKPNPAVCCLDPADCHEVGLDEVRSCTAGLACVDHQCEVPRCSMTGCEAATPVCNITTDVCEACTDASQCSRFTDTDVCDTATGACVECVTAADCSGTKPVCDGGTCRACAVDADCPSGACGDDGACVAEGAVVYLEAAGTDAGTCPRTAPCKLLAYGVGQTGSLRNHIVMAPGSYAEVVDITPQSTPASRLYIHGGGATLGLPPGTVESAVLTLTLPATIRNLEIQSEEGSASINLRADAYVLEHLHIRRGYVGIGVTSSATIRDVVIEDCADAILADPGSQLVVDRVTIARGVRGISAPNTTVQISNTLIHGSGDLGLNLTGSNGTVSFVTVADAGSDSGTGPRAVSCGTAVTVRSSIIWAPGTTARAPIAGCNLISVIAGPTAVPGATNQSPGFVDEATHDYHLAPNSPARDAVDTGPATDFEGDARPQGARFDIGADEAAP